MYMQFSPPFAFVEDTEEPGQYVPTGGLFWDGRASTLSEQAAGPFLNPREMALPDKQAVIDRVRQTDYAWMFEPLFGPDPFGSVEVAYQHVTDALAAYERTDRFNPFSSKFDAFLRGQAALTEHESLGFALFKDPEKGNCIACHLGNPTSSNPRDWLFTDFTYDNLGVPRNWEIPDNAVPTYYDLGLCQSQVVTDKIPAVIADKAAFQASLCGAFKVPTLRNVAKTAPYMHNGYFSELREVVEFYVTRETDPSRWYPRAEDGSLLMYNDLPAQYAANVNVTEVPYDRKLGQEPRLTPEEIDAVTAFLSSLNDGYHGGESSPTHPR
jgi:cytochrome c peroxidase